VVRAWERLGQAKKGLRSADGAQQRYISSPCGLADDYLRLSLIMMCGQGVRNGKNRAVATGESQGPEY
jgi:hypothetical protein